MDIGEKMQKMNFWRFSKVKDSLLTELKKHKDELELDELDMVTAARMVPQKPDSEYNKEY